MFEHRSQPLIPRLAFARRLLRALLVTLAIVALSLLAGTVTFSWLAKIDWHVAFHHTCLILAGHDGGPSELAQTTSEKLGLWGHVVCGLFVLYARLVFVALIAVISSPVLHRIFHKLHLDCEDTLP